MRDGGKLYGKLGLSMVELMMGGVCLVVHLRLPTLKWDGLYRAGFYGFTAMILQFKS